MAGRRSKATMRDVAALAGVSLASTSRALSRPETASPQLRELVRRACEKLNYIPNHLARSLSTDRTQSIGVIIPTIDNPVFAPMLQGIIGPLALAGYALSIGVSNRSKDEEFRQMRSMIERGVDGMLLGNPEHAPESVALLGRLKIPFVTVGGSARAMQSNAVTFDGAAAMALSVDHVVAAGHKRIGVFSGKRSVTPVIEDRLNGAISRLAFHGLMPREATILETDFTTADARRGALELLHLAQRPTAVVCTGDFHAMMLLTEARKSGVTVPDDLSITGCNEMFYIHLTSPILTTVRTPYFEVGQRGAEMILALLRSEPNHPQLLLESALVEGETVSVMAAKSKRAKPVSAIAVRTSDMAG